ncbi:MAG: ATP-binding protein [Pseudomonadota bacterium]|nr:ATP-binding protein [Pseudomonadota bacterium]
MASERTRRLLTAFSIAAAGLLAAALAGAPLFAALFALLGGGTATALFHWHRSEDRSSGPPASADGTPRLPSVLAALDDPLLLVRERKVLLANPAAKAVLGAHVEGADIRLAIRHPAAAEHLTDRSDGGARIELAGLGGQDRRWEMATALLPDETRLVRLSERSAAFAAEQMRTDFVANASHELRTPLASLLGFIETLQDDVAAEDKALRTRFLGIMLDEAQRMHRLVDDLMSLSRIEAERFSVPREPVPLLPLIDQVRIACGRMATERGVEILVNNRLDREPVVLGDGGQLLQLLQNLIVNAIKYGNEGTPVTVRFAESGPDMLRMSVIDRGEGIAPEHLPRLTERFYRVDASRSRNMGGTGLGLAIVKHIVGRHRGRLEIASRQSEGTEVDVYLPRASS